jgi:hypothetical protein
MTTITVRRMSEKGAVDTLNEICDGMKDFIGNNRDSAKELICGLIENVLDPLAAEDFFGTEGWEHAFRLED